MKVTISGVTEEIRHVTPTKVEKTYKVRYTTDTDYRGTVFIPDVRLRGLSEKEVSQTIFGIVAADARGVAGVIGKEISI